LRHRYVLCRRSRDASRRSTKNRSCRSSRRNTFSLSKSSSWTRLCNGVGELLSQTSARQTSFTKLVFFRNADLDTHTRSSQTNSRAASFVSSVDCKSLFVRWRRLQKLLATLNYSKNSKMRPRCWSGQTRSSSPHRCISRLPVVRYLFRSLATHTHTHLSTPFAFSSYTVNLQRDPLSD
jgi:hypothetical protein